MKKLLITSSFLLIISGCANTNDAKPNNIETNSTQQSSSAKNVAGYTAGYVIGTILGSLI